MGIVETLLGSRQITGTPSVQPNVSVMVHEPYFRLTHISREPMLNTVTDNFIVTSPVGYTEPNPMVISGMPPNQSIASVGQIRTNDNANVSGGKCNG